MIYKKRSFICGILWVVLILGYWEGMATSLQAASQGPPKGRIVIGAVLDLTGRGAARGRHARDALLLEETRTNQSRDTSLGRVHLVTIDSEGKAGIVSKAVKRLAEEFGATAIIGPSNRESAIAAAQEAERARIPLISLSVPESILRPVRRWIFSTAHPVALAVNRSYSHIQTKRFRRIAILTSGSSLGREGREILSALAPDLGFSLLLNERFPEKEHNFLPYLQKAHLRGAQAFLHWSNGPSRLAVARARQALDIRIPIYMAAVVSKSYDLEGAGRAFEGVMFPATRVFAADLLARDVPGRRSIMKFRKEFRQRFGQLPDGLAGYAADALRMIGRAIQGGNPSRSRIRKRLETLGRYEGLTGIYRMTASDHNGLSPNSLIMVQIKGGKWTMAGTE